MAKLTKAQRDALPDAAFAGPNRTYPIEDRAHAADAKGRATQAVKAGRMSEQQAARIDKAADAVLDKD